MIKKNFIGPVMVAKESRFVDEIDYYDETYDMRILRLDAEEHEN